MALTINTNTTASIAGASLNKNNNMLSETMESLSSGVKIKPYQDAGGIAVAMKMGSAIRRNSAVQTNISNAVSFLQTQDGACETVANILDRMSELRTMYDDVTKSSEDKSTYQTEFTQLQAQLVNIKSESFNGVNLFVSGGSTLSVKTTEDAAQSVDISQGDLVGSLSVGGGDLSASANTLGSSVVTVSNIRSAIQNVATMRAANGAQTSQLKFASELLVVNRANLEAAKSRIIDTDVAEASTKLSKYNILNNFSATMLAQANSQSQTAMRLVQ